MLAVSLETDGVQSPQIAKVVSRSLEPAVRDYLAAIPSAVRGATPRR